MYSIIAILIVCIFLLFFYKWCGDRKKLFYRTLLCLGVVPFICDFIYSLRYIKKGFSLFDFETVYGVEAFINSFFVSMIFFYIIFIPSAIAVIVSVIKLIKLKNKKK